MPKTFLALAASALILGASVAPAMADFHPLRTARSAANLGLNTAKSAVDLGLDTAQDIVTPDTCRHHTRYKGADGRWHRCRRQ
jgi:hypothetical protein